jgi:hypothetical protein
LLDIVVVFISDEPNKTNMCHMSFEHMSEHGIAGLHMALLYVFLNNVRLEHNAFGRQRYEH